jgi:peptidoglycan/LPS O-acetylase OafA/YrhL
MSEKRQYHGLDVTKVILAVLVSARHVIQIFYPAESKWRMVIGGWLSNLAVPGFFVMAGFLLFRKVESGKWQNKKRSGDHQGILPAHREIGADLVGSLSSD